MADVLAHVDMEENLKDDVVKELGTNRKSISLLCKEAISYAASNGFLVMKENEEFVHAPFSLFPTKYSRDAFDRAMELAPIYNLLVNAVAQDVPWLLKTLQPVVEKDAFTGRLMELLKECHDLPQTGQLGIFRSDYMLHEPDDDTLVLQQVELNTIASSFGMLSGVVGQTHAYLCRRFENSIPDAFKEYAQNLPENKSHEKLTKAFQMAHALYGKPEAVVVFIVQPKERNTMDQRLLEYQLWERHGIPVVRKSLLQMSNECTIADDGTLMLTNTPVSVVYFRAGYTPEDYPTESEWEARQMIEKSLSIKCPSIAYHLVGTKKVQQALAIPRELEKFVSNPQHLKLLQSSFSGLYGLERDTTGETQRLIEKVLLHPSEYVMKPQREGGGNNLYGTDITNALTTLSPQDLETYIIMTRITPRPFPAILVKNNTILSGSCITELGIYSTILTRGKVLLNESAGHLLRTKRTNVNEGGVASGFSVLSSPYLME